MLNEIIGNFDNYASFWSVQTHLHALHLKLVYLYWNSMFSSAKLLNGNNWHKVHEVASFSLSFLYFHPLHPFLLLLLLQFFMCLQHFYWNEHFRFQNEHNFTVASSLCFCKHVLMQKCTMVLRTVVLEKPLTNSI